MKTVLILIQTIWHSDSVPQWIFWKSWSWKKSADDNKSMKSYPTCKELTMAPLMKSPWNQNLPWKVPYLKTTQGPWKVTLPFSIGQGQYKLFYLHFVQHFICGSRGGTGGPTPPEKSQNIGFSSNTGRDHLKNHKASKPALNVGSSSARQLNAI